MSLDAAKVHQVAELARLAIRDEDLPTYASELSSILELVDKLQSADTANVEPMAHPLDMVQRLRPDAVSEANQREKFMTNAPEEVAGVYVVPRVIE